MATQETTIATQTTSPPSQADLDAVARCVEDHAQALLAFLAAAGESWDASPYERHLLTGLVGAQDSPHQRAAGQ
jgi:hypothetical protein